MNSQSVSMVAGAASGAGWSVRSSAPSAQQPAPIPSGKSVSTSGSASFSDNSSASDASPSVRMPGQSGGYFSPVMRFDQSAGLAVLHFRDFETGETTDQVPAKWVVEQYRQGTRTAPSSAAAAASAAQFNFDPASGNRLANQSVTPRSGQGSTGSSQAAMPSASAPPENSSARGNTPTMQTGHFPSAAGSGNHVSLKV